MTVFGNMYLFIMGIRVSLLRGRITEPSMRGTMNRFLLSRSIYFYFFGSIINFINRIGIVSLPMCLGNEEVGEGDRE